MAQLKAAIITDIHYGIDSGRRMGSKAPTMIEHFIDAVNNYDPDLVIDMGDRVSARGEEQDRDFMTELRSKFNRLAAPVNSVIGNHDVKYLSPDDNETIMGSPASSYSRDVNGYHLVFWNPNVDRAPGQGLFLKPGDLEWLKDDLASTDKPAVIFSHVPLDNLPHETPDELTGGSDTETAADTNDTAPISSRFFYPEAAQIREVIENAGNVVLCMAGHRHKKRVREIGGVHYVTQQAFLNNYNDGNRVSRTYSYLELDEDRIRIQMRGHDRQRLDLIPRYRKPDISGNPDRQPSP